MSRFLRQLVCVALALALLGVASVSATDKPDTPKGAEKALAAIQKTFPKSEIDSIAEPRGFGGSGGKGTPMFWSVRFHIGDKKYDLSVLPDGTIMRVPTAVDLKELPKPVVEAVAQAAPGWTVKSAEKNEMRVTLKYVPLDKPQVSHYKIEASANKVQYRLTMTSTAGNLKVTRIKETKEKEVKTPDKEIAIPEKAAKAVKAIKALYPEAIVKQITTEVFDDGSGDIEILTYEIEFVAKGVEHEMVASPEGVVPHVWAAVDLKNLPVPVKDAVNRAIIDVTIEKAQAREQRATLKFGPLEKPKVYYTVTAEKDSKTQTIRVKPDGTIIKEPALPKGKEPTPKGKEPPKSKEPAPKGKEPAPKGKEPAPKDKEAPSPKGKEK